MTNHVSFEYIMFKTLYWLQSSFLELVLSLVQSQVNLIHLMVHFPKLISLMLVWGLHRSPALISIPETFTCPIGFWWICDKAYSGGLNGLLFCNIALDLHLRNSWPLDGVMLQFLHWCRRLQYLWFDSRHEQVPSAMLAIDIISVVQQQLDPSKANCSFPSHSSNISRDHSHVSSL